MNTFNPKLLDGFDQKPLLERLELIYKHQEDLFDAKALDKAISHFQEELTQLEIQEFRESDAKDLKKQRFENQLTGLKALSGNIRRAREQAERQIKEKKALAQERELNLEKVSAWENKLNNLISELLVKLDHKQKITGRRHWEVFQELKKSQPENSRTKKLKEWKDFLNDIPEYAAFKYQKRLKIKKEVEKKLKDLERKNNRSKKTKFILKWAAVASAGFLAVFSPYLYKKSKDFYETQKLVSDTKLRQRYQAEILDGIRNHASDFINTISLNEIKSEVVQKFFNIEVDRLSLHLETNNILNITLGGTDSFSLSGSGVYDSAVKDLLVVIETHKEKFLKKVKNLKKSNETLEVFAKAYLVLAFNQVLTVDTANKTQTWWDFTEPLNESLYKERLKTAKFFSGNIKDPIRKKTVEDMIYYFEEKLKKFKVNDIEAKKIMRETQEFMVIANKRGEAFEALKNKPLSELSPIFYEMIYGTPSEQLLSLGKTYSIKINERLIAIQNMNDSRELLNEMRLFEKHRRRLVELQMHFSNGQTKESVEFGSKLVLAYGYQCVANYLKKIGQPYQTIDQKADQYWKETPLPPEKIKHLKLNAGTESSSMNFGLNNF